MPDNDPPHRQQNLSIRSLGREPDGVDTPAHQTRSRICETSAIEVHRKKQELNTCLKLPS